MIDEIEREKIHPLLVSWQADFEWLSLYYAGNAYGFHYFGKLLSTKKNLKLLFLQYNYTQIDHNLNLFEEKSKFQEDKK